MWVFSTLLKNTNQFTTCYQQLPASHQAVSNQSPSRSHPVTKQFPPIHQAQVRLEMVPTLHEADWSSFSSTISLIPVYRFHSWEDRHRRCHLATAPPLHYFLHPEKDDASKFQDLRCVRWSETAGSLLQFEQGVKDLYAVLQIPQRRPTSTWRCMVTEETGPNRKKTRSRRNPFMVNSDV